MKRKKGAKGSLKKVKKNDLIFMDDPNSPSISIEGENYMGQTGESQGKFELEVKQPTCLDNRIAKGSNSDADVSSFKSKTNAGHSRVKVKLKTSKLLEDHKRSSDAIMPSVNTPSDTDKSNSQFAMEMNEMTSSKMDATWSDGQALETSNVVPENPTRKTGSIKIKSSRGSGLSDFSAKQMESKIPHKEFCYNTKDLNSALTVIRKVMKMDAAGPFNAPVNPVALGIPDYFDIIDTPMDFGSICNDLEHGAKYKNSLDVYNDVQFIWDNCYKYNNKGDYILELMKRVKKNFMKYWTAAGLLTEMPIGTQVEDVLRSHQDKSTSKIKSKHKRRRHGIDGHKSNCLCAVCVVRRRRKEREEQSGAFETHMIVTHASLSNEPKLEVSSADNPCSEGTASTFDHSPETEADAEMGEAGKVESRTILEPTGSDEPEKIGASCGEIELYPNATNNENFDNLSHENGNKDDSNQHFNGEEWPQSNSSKHSYKKDEDENDDEIRQGELYPSGQEIKLLENPPQQENNSVLWLCRDLFSGDRKSVWNGPHSLNRKLSSATARQNNPIRSALATLMHS
ncbi:ankyrin repeat, bromo and BTB domain-containing protein DDB_G0293800 [Dendrobium catenatum]|uniref:Transcription factor GTE6 n=1 Tax=Dendrobium catenatum TaxID=906689 RepID=A0A2I0WB65_9ASPA|nr:ankyrin repeat, bromo and BTB domain-containing protein DDB_G0293800 [Dendrobium catenatum]PKU72901.1 Transcription factor GTE6 [Dendrobium catenatum]